LAPKQGAINGKEYFLYLLNERTEFMRQVT